MSSGARTYADARAYFVNQLYREWGTAFGRNLARLRAHRLEWVGGRGRRAPTFGLTAEDVPEPGEIALPGLYDDADADVGGGLGTGRAAANARE